LVRGKLRPAFAMIELIFSLVIMGIVLMSAPLLIQQSTQSVRVALQQEAISIASAHTMMLLSLDWDENNTDLEAGDSPILDTNRFYFDFNNTTSPVGLRNVSGREWGAGLVNVKTATQMGSFGFERSADPDKNETSIIDADDVDDYNNSDIGLAVFNFENIDIDKGDYVDTTINLHSVISYREDRPNSGPLSTDINISGVINSTTRPIVSNIKFIQVSLTSRSGVDELDKNISMSAFSCNIGTFAPKGEVEL